MNEKHYLLLGRGIGNQAVQNYFESEDISYQVIDDMTIQGIDLNPVDIVVKSSGISTSQPLVQACLKKKLKIVTDLELFSLVKEDVPLIGVTGSNGKTTTTTLIYQILEADLHYEVCGNIGIPVMNYANISHPGYVIECSSFMLEYADSFHPQVFVLLNIIPHHLEHHHSYEDYFNAKTKPLKNMNYHDILIFNLDDEELKRAVSKARSRKMCFSKKSRQATIYCDEEWIYYLDQPYLKISTLLIKNSTIIDDFMVAILVGKIFKIDDCLIKEKLQMFKGLAHRQEIIFENNQLTIINDSKATNPAATLCAFENEKVHNSSSQLFWIGGGKLINDDYTILIPYLGNIKKTYLYGENQDMLIKKLSLNDFNYQLFPTLEKAIEQVFNELIFPSTILFSPASPSTDVFKSYEERGNTFKKLVSTMLAKRNI